MRHKYNKRKEAASRQKLPTKRKSKIDRDKDVFKRRKFIKNTYVEEPNLPSESSSEDESPNNGYGQMLHIFATNKKDKAAIDSDSEDAENSDQNDEFGIASESRERDLADGDEESDDEKNKFSDHCRVGYHFESLSLNEK